MGFLDRLAALFSTQDSGSKKRQDTDSDGRGLYFYVQCSACGEKIKVRVNPVSDLQQEFSDNDRTTGYTLEKDVLGNKCFRMMHLHAEFDAAKRLQKTSVTNGALMSKADFLQP